MCSYFLMWVSLIITTKITKIPTESMMSTMKIINKLKICLQKNLNILTNGLKMVIKNLLLNKIKLVAKIRFISKT